MRLRLTLIDQEQERKTVVEVPLSDLRWDAMTEARQALRALLVLVWGDAVVEEWPEE